jgi:hypothetical protein
MQRVCDPKGPDTRLVRQLRKRESQLVRTHPFGFLAEEPLTEQIELMAERGVLALDSGEFVLERGDERPRRGEIVEVSRRLVRHADLIRERDPPYKTPTRSHDSFIKRCPESGSRASRSRTSAHRPSIDCRRSVAPVAR